MVLGYHVIFTTYGFWLPNDPRGSWSEFVGAWELFRFGHATKINTRQSQAAIEHDSKHRLAAKSALKYPAVHFTGVQARAVGEGFAKLAEKSDLAVRACSILPEHVHMVIGRHTYHIEQAVTLFKGEATRQLIGQGLHPFRGIPPVRGRLPQPWARGEWKVYLDDLLDIERAIKYVEENPLKKDKPLKRGHSCDPSRQTRSPRGSRLNAAHAGSEPWL